MPELRKLRLEPSELLRRAAYLAWGGWLIVTLLIFSFMAGIFHDYYTVALAPAIAALIGMGAVVIRDVPPNSIMVGNPARRLKDRVGEPKK